MKNLMASKAVKDFGLGQEAQVMAPQRCDEALSQDEHNTANITAHRHDSLKKLTADPRRPDRPIASFICAEWHKDIWLLYTDSKRKCIVASVLLPRRCAAARDGDERRQRRGERIVSPMSKEESKCCKARSFRLL